MIKLIHPKTGVVREFSKSHQNKINILKRGGFILFENYRPKKEPVVVPDPTVAEVVVKNKEDAVDQADVLTAEVAIHVSPAARVLIEENDLDPALIDGTGKDGAITKPDVNDYLEKETEKEPVVRAATEEEEAAEAELSKIGRAHV